jgi:hypothetical protein
MRYTKWLSIVIGLLLWVSGVEATPNSRVFPGGAATDNVVSTATITPAQLTCVFIRFNITTLDATTRRMYDWSNGTVLVNTLITSNIGTFSYVDGRFATSGGTWTISPLSTGAEHDALLCHDAGNVANLPVIYIDGSSVTVTLSIAPVGALSAVAQKVTIGNRTDLTRSFPGTVSTLAIWTGTLLSSAIATQLHNGMPPCRISTANLVMYYAIDGVSPEPEQVSQNNGTITATTVGTVTTSAYDQHCLGKMLTGVGR